MSYPIAYSKEAIYSLDRPIFYPVRVIAKPLLWVVAKIRRVFEIFIGYFARIGVFSFGEWNRSYVKKKIIDLYKGGCYDTHDRTSFNPLRLEQAFVVLEKIGGKNFKIDSKDGTKLDAMLLRYRDIKTKIEENGGKIVDCFPVTIDQVKREGKERTYYCHENRIHPNEFIDVILSDCEGEKWGTFYETIGCLGLEKIEIKQTDGKMLKGFVMKRWDKQKPTRPKANQCFVRCNPPTESYPMGKRDILRFIFSTRGDVLAFDYRGTGKSEGIPTEGGYFLDAETMVEKAVIDFGYDWKNIWGSGFCLGGGVVLHLKNKYHDKGINVFIQNTFDSMLNTFKKQIFPANYLAPYGLNEVRSREPKICSRVEQFSFDNIRKMNQLRGKEKKGFSIVCHTDTDTFIDSRSHPRLSSALDYVSKKTFSLMYSPEDRDKNGHSLDVLSDPFIWKNAVTYITAKDYPEILEDSPVSPPMTWKDRLKDFCPSMRMILD